MKYHAQQYNLPVILFIIAKGYDDKSPFFKECMAL